MEELLNAKCVVPTYLLENEEEAYVCGQCRGQVISFWLCFFLSIYVWMNSNAWEWKETASFIVLFASTCFTVLPWFFGSIKMQMWRGYQFQKKAYERLGFTPREAILHIQHIYVYAYSSTYEGQILSKLLGKL